MSPNVAYPGPAGSHTSAAAATLFPNQPRASGIASPLIVDTP